MSERTWWESVKVEGGQVIDKVKQVVREGNVRRIRDQAGRPRRRGVPAHASGVVGAVFAPMLAAVGAIVGAVDGLLDRHRALATDRRARAAATDRAARRQTPRLMPRRFPPGASRPRG